MHPQRLLPCFILFTVIGLLLTRQQVTETLLLYEIQQQQQLTIQLDDDNQRLHYQVNRWASPEKLTLALAQKSGSLEGPPVAIVRVEETGKQDPRLAKRGKGLLERLSLIRIAEAGPR